ncbi:MAG: type V CRISPR-associated protein Cas4 [Flavobacteriales bacterium]|nr:type V CRISPR-associated protein Cas4 [Flavobacteriales bacterium]
MEPYIPISYLNDFVFCPRSIYFHNIYGNFSKFTYDQTPQIAGRAAHRTIDTETYSTRSAILQGLEVYTEKYGIMGKIDVYETETGKLIERKRKIVEIYDGYVFQLYAQYFSLKEMGYNVKQLFLHDLSHNCRHCIELPENNRVMFLAFEELVEKIKSFDLDDPFTANPRKCKNCIYSNLCDKNLC